MNANTLKIKESINNSCNSLRDEFPKWKTSILIATLIWFTTTVLQIDRLFFQYDEETKNLLIVKLSYFGFLVCFIKFFIYAKSKISEGDPEFLRGWQVFRVYFSILSVLMLILWPGTWIWDDLGIILSISDYSNFCAWQHIFSGYFHDIFLQLFPFPAGIIVIRNFINALCVAFAVVKIEKLFNIGKLNCTFLDYFIKLIPFLLPPVLIYQFSGYRIGQYIYLELVLFTMLIAKVKERTYISWPYSIFLIFLCVVCSTWRTEAFIYIPATCIAICFIDKKFLSNQRKFDIFLLIVIGFICCNHVQKNALGNKNYELISLTSPCAAVVNVANKETEKDLLDKINKVMSVDVILNNANARGEELFWALGIVKNGYTTDEFNDFFKSFIILSMKHPEAVFKERWKMFILATASGNNAWIPSTYALFDYDNNSAAKAAISKNWFAFKPPFKKNTKKTC